MSEKIKVLRIRDGSFAVMEDGWFTYAGGLSYEAANRIADRLRSGASADDIAIGDRDDPWADLGYERRERAEPNDEYG